MTSIATILSGVRMDYGNLTRLDPLLCTTL